MAWELQNRIIKNQKKLYSYCDTESSQNIVQEKIIWKKEYAGAVGLIVSFRGMEVTEKKNIITDIKFIPVNFDDMGRVHQGFEKAVDSVWEDMKSYLTNQKQNPEIITKGCTWKKGAYMVYSKQNNG